MKPHLRYQMPAPRLQAASLLLLAILAPGVSGRSGGLCAMRDTCVQHKVCDCAVETPGCAGSARCPFPGDGVPCVVSADDSGPKQVQPPTLQRDRGRDGPSGGIL